METDLLKLRLYITTSNRIVKDPACQMMLMESAIHKAMTLGTVSLLLLHSQFSFRTWSSAVTRNAVHTSFSRARRAANDTLYDVSAALDDQKSIYEILVKAFWRHWFFSKSNFDRTCLCQRKSSSFLRMRFTWKTRSQENHLSGNSLASFIKLFDWLFLFGKL